MVVLVADLGANVTTVIVAALSLANTIAVATLAHRQRGTHQVVERVAESVNDVKPGGRRRYDPPANG